MDTLQRLDQAGAIYLDRHFVYTSGKHGPAYIDSDPIFPDTELVAELSRGLVEPFLGEVDTVAAPATGGIVLAVATARAFLDSGQNVATTWADKVAGGGFAFERSGFVEAISGRRVLVVEDLLNTGGSVENVCRLVEQHNGRLVGASVICNRGSVTASQLGVPRLEAMTSVQFTAFDAQDCPLCADNIPIVEDIAHGNKYKAEHPGYEGGFTRLLDH
jgi:orotate phosphoribosyltransferase